MSTDRVRAKWPFTNGFKINQVTSLVLCCLRDWLLLFDHSALRLQWHLNFSRIFWNLSSVFLKNVIGCHLVRKKPHFSPFKLHFHAFNLFIFSSFMIWKFILMSNVFSMCWYCRTCEKMSWKQLVALEKLSSSKHKAAQKHTNTKACLYISYWNCIHYE